MKHASLVAAAALVVLANSVALIHAARNRSGEAEAETVLTHRELYYHRDPDNSGVSLRLRWVDTNPDFGHARVHRAENATRIWLDSGKLTELGFDCGLAPPDPKAGSFYTRQIPRTGFVAFEYDGPSWQSWLEQVQAEPGEKSELDERKRSRSRLVPIDAARDAAVLRARHPARKRVVILPAVIRIALIPATAAASGSAEKPARLSGYIRDVPSDIHVPRPFSDGFRGLPQPRSEGATYRVHLRFGSLLEPWVTGVELVAR